MLKGKDCQVAILVAFSLAKLSSHSLSNVSGFTTWGFQSGELAWVLSSSVHLLPPEKDRWRITFSSLTGSRTWEVSCRPLASCLYNGKKVAASLGSFYSRRQFRLCWLPLPSWFPLFPLACLLLAFVHPVPAISAPEAQTTSQTGSFSLSVPVAFLCLLTISSAYPSCEACVIRSLRICVPYSKRLGSLCLGWTAFPQRLAKMYCSYSSANIYTVVKEETLFSPPWFLSTVGNLNLTIFLCVCDGAVLWIVDLLWSIHPLDGSSPLPVRTPESTSVSWKSSITPSWESQCLRHI